MLMLSNQLATSFDPLTTLLLVKVHTTAAVYAPFVDLCGTWCHKQFCLMLAIDVADIGGEDLAL